MAEIAVTSINTRIKIVLAFMLIVLNELDFLFTNKFLLFSILGEKTDYYSVWILKNQG